jgi:hypothetical protein
VRLRVTQQLVNVLGLGLVATKIRGRRRVGTVRTVRCCGAVARSRSTVDAPLTAPCAIRVANVRGDLEVTQVIEWRRGTGRLENVLELLAEPLSSAADATKCSPVSEVGAVETTPEVEAERCGSGYEEARRRTTWPRAGWMACCEA